MLRGEDGFRSKDIAAAQGTVKHMGSAVERQVEMMSRCG